MKPAARTYGLQIVAAMTFYAVALIASVFFLRSHPASPWRLPAALIPMLPALTVPIFAMRFVAQTDELQRRIQLEALAFAFLATAVGTFGYGLMQNAGLPALNWMFVWPLMATTWVVGLAFAQRRYR